MNTPSVIRRGLGAVCAAWLLLAGPAVARESLLKIFWEKWTHKDVDVITVTDVTEAGKAMTAADRDQPVRYQLIYAGEIGFDSTWGGEPTPPKQEIIRWIMASLESQGCLPADKDHPAEQVLVFGWGRYGGGSYGPTIGFLGGEKVNLIWGKYQFGSMHNRHLFYPQMIRTNLAEKIAGFAWGSLFVGIVRSYAVDSLDRPKPTLLWETRFGCPSAGLALDEAMPLLIKAASANFGRETVRPVNLNASDAFGGSVTFGEFKVLGEYKTREDDDLSAKTKELADQLAKATRP